MLLTEQQHDGLSEIINIAFSRTAASLSELTGERVLLDVPEVAVCPSYELPQRLTALVPGEVVTVHQIFSGSVAGDAMLLLDHAGATLLTALLTGDTLNSKRLDASAREVLTEVGNILLNACLGVFGDLLQVHVSFTVPRLQLESLHGLLDSLTVGSQELRYALVVSTAFRLRDGAIGGYLVIVLSVASLDRLLQAIDALA